MTYITQKSGSLGADVRSIRKSRGITLIEMSETLDRSVGWMSQVERDISEPSIEELRAIAKALTVPVSIFFGQAEAHADEIGYVVRKDTRRKIGGGAVGLVEELLSPDLTDDFEMIHSNVKGEHQNHEWLNNRNWRDQLNNNSDPYFRNTIDEENYQTY